MLFQELGKMKRKWIMTSIIMMAVGIVMILCPERYSGMLITGAGYVLLVTATVMALGFLSCKKVLMDYVSLTGALVIGIVGLFVLVYRDNVLQTLSLLFGLLLILEGINDAFNTFMYARRAGRKGWWVLMVLAGILFVCGVILLTNPWWNRPAALMDVIGGMMMFSAVASILRVIWIWPFKEA